MVFPIVLVFFSLVCISNAKDPFLPWDCKLPKSQAIQLFEKKIINNPWPDFPNNPYLNQTKHSLQVINETIHNRDIVCAIQYTDSNHIHYTLRQFENKAAALKANFIITHQGHCGACSTLPDLAVYLKMNLTAPVRKCGIESSLSDKWSMDCLMDLGFTRQCAQIWFYDAVNTKKHCFWPCIVDWVEDEPYNLPDGQLNPCLECDETISGPVFKYFSGRTRRDSGIRSAIHRPHAQVYPMEHCYYD